MYKAVTKDQLAENLAHLRRVFRDSKASTRQEEIANDAREIFTRNLLSNLTHLSEHPMPQMVAEAAQVFQLTMEGAHQLFGYDLGEVRKYDLTLNQARTRIIESYSFRRDLPIELPLKFGNDEAFARTSFLRELVRDWQGGLPIRGLQGSTWQRPGTFYVQVGTEDSLGSSLPPGTIAAIEPVGEEEFWHPDAGHIYLLQFGNGYLCCGCVVADNRLLLNVVDRRYTGRDEFRYPGSVRVAGRVRNFVVGLPYPESRSLRSLPSSRSTAPLLLPWQYRSLSQLFHAKSRRFRRPRHEVERVRSAVEAVLARSTSARTARRYRAGGTASTPHVNSLIELSLLHMVRYSDVLRVLGLFSADTNRYSLETLLSVDRLSNLSDHHVRIRTPIPEHRWQAALNEWGEWSTLLSLRFPLLQPLQDQVIRLHQSGVFNGLDPLLPPGTILLLDEARGTPTTHADHRKTDWARPIYVLRKGRELFCGYLEVDRDDYILVPHPRVRSHSLIFGRDEISEVRRAIGAAIPL